MSSRPHSFPDFCYSQNEEQVAQPGSQRPLLHSQPYLYLFTSLSSTHRSLQAAHCSKAWQGPSSLCPLHILPSLRRATLVPFSIRPGLSPPSLPHSYISLNQCYLLSTCSHAGVCPEPSHPAYLTTSPSHVTNLYLLDWTLTYQSLFSGSLSLAFLLNS